MSKKQNIYDSIDSEDTVQCYIFPTSNFTGDLCTLCDTINETVEQLTTGYIWHKDRFKVYIPVSCKDETTDGLPHLVSITHFGDNIEDEWFIVYLLLEISKQQPELVIQVYDNDGDFILIEAADYLPSWANPETTENRVFIYQNKVHLIPPKLADLDTDLQIQEAIELIVESPEKTKSSEILQAIHTRIGNYPNIIEERFHRALVKIPLEIAAILNLKPSLISPIVNAYSHHDVIDIKTCKNVIYNDCVTTQVKFTKCLYAMLIHSKLMKTGKMVNENDRQVNLGFKLTCGFKIIMNRLSDDLFSTKEFIKFKKSLTDNGYFKNNIEGSRDYIKLLEQAKEYFLSVECPINKEICDQVTKIMQTEQFTEMKQILKIKPAETTEDSDDWLNIHPDQLNDLLNSRYGKHNKYKSGDVINSQTITNELSSFLKKSSDYEGIETSKDDDDEEDEDNEEGINFNSEEFLQSLQKIMKVVTGESLDSSLLDSDMDDDTVMSEDDLDKELKESLHPEDKLGAQDSKTMVNNILNSMKEEKGSSGPSSNLLRTIGVSKKDVLDSDDDENSD